MIIIIETIILCIIFSLLCYFGTGTDEKNLKSYSSYPDEVRSRIKDIAEYQGQFKESNKIIAFVSNFLLFLCLLFALGLLIREKNYWHNFLALTVIGQGLNFFDLLIIDLYGGETQSESVLRKFKKRSCIKIPQNILKHLAEH